MLIPYSLFFLAAVLLLACSRKKVFFLVIGITVFMVAWRTKWTISSTRYFVAYLIVAFSAIAIALKVISRKHTLGKRFCVCALFLTCINLFILFSSFRNIYVFDIEDQVREVGSNSENKIFLNEKEYKRFGQFPGIDIIQDFPENRSDIEVLCNRYAFCQENAYIFFRNQESPGSEFSWGNDIDLRKTQQFYTDKNKRKTCSIFLLKKYVPPLYYDPNLNGYTDLEEVLKNGTLECYNLTSDSYIFRYEDNLFWVIGMDIDKNAEIIFHVFTDRLDLLPRNQKRFDNRGFRLSSRSRMKDCGNYKVFKQSIPKEYPISRIRAGINDSGKIIWFREFPLSNQST